MTTLRGSVGTEKPEDSGQIVPAGADERPICEAPCCHSQDESEPSSYWRVKPQVRRTAETSGRRGGRRRLRASETPFLAASSQQRGQALKSGFGRASCPARQANRIVLDGAVLRRMRAAVLRNHEASTWFTQAESMLAGCGEGERGSPLRSPWIGSLFYRIGRGGMLGMWRRLVGARNDEEEQCRLAHSAGPAPPSP